MKQNDSSSKFARRLAALTTAVLLSIGLTQTGCKKSESGDASGGGKKSAVIQNIGSDTMVNLAQAWAEAYHAVDPGVSVEVSGGGSGIGVAALINGTCDIANSSRHLDPEEVEKARAKYGGAPKEVKVGYDALAIYVHPSSPLTEISIEELSEIYREGGKFSKWSDLGVKVPGAQDEIILLSRQNNSGTYHYFREAVVGKKADFRKGSRDLNGSKDVVALIENTPGAIGYSGIGYRTDKVKVLKVSKKKGDPGIEATTETTLNGTYPIARPMYFYTPPNPPPHVTKYIDWVLGAKGQGMIEEKGYIPLKKQ